jgi:hypothetical protein
MKLIHTCMALMIAGAITPAVAAAQQPAPPAAQHERAKDPDPVTGNILSVDTNSKTLIIKSGDSDIKFSYSEETEIVGADTGSEGLATKAGTPVTVTYTVHGTANVAVRIEVLPKSKGH